MKISLFTDYGALNSPPIFNSLSKGLIKLGHEVITNSLDADVYVIWSLLFQGRMAENRRIWQYAISKRIPIIVIEVSALHRNILWRIGVNGLTLPPHLFQEDRPEYLKIKLKPWTKSGDNILICCQRSSSQLWNNGDTYQWLLSTIRTVRQYSDRHIIIRPHPREPIFFDFSAYNVSFQHPAKIQNTYDDYDFSLENIWIVINSSSSPAIQSIINGVPVITDFHSLAYPMSTKVADIEQPCYHHREQWLNQLCHLEWYQSELEDSTILSNILRDVLIK